MGSWISQPQTGTSMITTVETQNMQREAFAEVVTMLSSRAARCGDSVIKLDHISKFIKTHFGISMKRAGWIATEIVDSLLARKQLLFFDTTASSVVYTIPKDFQI